MHTELQLCTELTSSMLRIPERNIFYCSL